MNTATTLRSLGVVELGEYWTYVAIVVVAALFVAEGVRRWRKSANTGKGDGLSLAVTVGVALILAAHLLIRPLPFLRSMTTSNHQPTVHGFR